MNLLWRLSLILALAGSALPSPAAAKVKLTYWQGWLAPEHIEVEKEIVADFMRQNPAIEVEFAHMTNPGQQVKVTFAAGVLADVVVSSRDDFPDWQQIGAFRNLGPYLAKDPMFQREFVPQLLELFKVNGDPYGLPFSANGRGLFAYEAERLAEAGVPEPGVEPWRWDEFVTYGKKLVRYDREQMTQAAFSVNRTPAAVWTWFWANDTDLFTDNFTKLTVTEGKVLETLDFLRSLILEDGIAPRADQKPVSVIGSGVGPWSFVPWQKAYQQGGPQKKLMWQPYNGSKKRVAMLGGSGLQIASTTKHPEEAWRLLRYLTSEEVQWKRFLRGYGTSSLTKNLARGSRLTDGPIPEPRAIYWEASTYGKVQPSFPKYRSWSTIWNNYTAKLLAGEISVNEAAEQIGRETETLLRSN